MSSSPLLSECIMDNQSPAIVMPRTFQQDPGPAMDQYLSRITSDRLVSMARISQMLRHNALIQQQSRHNDSVQQQSQSSMLHHNALMQQQSCHNDSLQHHSQSSRPRHNEPMQPAPSNNNMSMSSDSSLDSQALRTMTPCAAQKSTMRRFQTNTRALPNRNCRFTKSTLYRNSMYSERDTMPSLQHVPTNLSSSLDNLNCDNHEQDASPFTKFSRHRATFHGGSIHSNLVARLQGEVQPALGKESMVVGKAILKLAVYVNSGMLTVYVKAAQHLESPTSTLCNSQVQVSLPGSERPVSCTPCRRDTNHPQFDDRFSFELAKEDHHKRLLVTVWNSSHSEEKESLGCMSFGIKNIVQGKRAINGWYYLLKEEVGQRKHLQAVSKKVPKVHRGQP